MALLPWMYLTVVCYLLGSLPSAYLAGRFLKGVDIRQLGDHNPGAANAWAQLGPPIGAAVAMADIAKGAGAVAIARGLGGGEEAAMLGGFAAVAGHNWPVFLGFRGGRGAATALGVLVSLLPSAVLPLTAVAAVPLAITRSTLVAFAFLYAPLPLVAWYLGFSWLLVGYAGALPLVVGVSHFLSVRRWHHEGEVRARIHPRG